ncbi:MAG: hypothetical protein ABEJ07_05655 [Candidatus Nanohaloarchaea archaeon]
MSVEDGLPWNPGHGETIIEYAERLDMPWLKDAASDAMEDRIWWNSSAEDIGPEHIAYVLKDDEDYGLVEEEMENGILLRGTGQFPDSGGHHRLTGYCGCHTQEERRRPGRQ